MSPTSHRIRARRLTAACFLATAGLLTPAESHAATKTYVGADNGFWNPAPATAANWSPSGDPAGSVDTTINPNFPTHTVGDDVILGSHSAGTTNLTVNFNDIYGDGTRGTNQVRSLTLNSSALTNAMIFNQASSTSVMSVELTESIGTTTSVNIYNHSAGHNTAATLQMGVNANVNANTYNLSGTGVASFGAANIGVSGSGTFNQTGGTAYVGLGLGVNATGTGYYNLYGGTLSSTGSIGISGNGTFNQTGGTHDADNLYVGAGTGTGTYNLSAGALEGDCTVRNGTFTQTGGAVEARITVGGGTSGTYALQGGTLTNNNFLGDAITLNPNGLFLLQGGTLSPTTTLTLFGGKFQLLGHSLTLAKLNGTGGVVESGAGNVVLTLNSNDPNSYLPNFSGTIQNGASSILSLTKTGSVNQYLSGNNTYTGSTVVNAGSLILKSDTALPAASVLVINGGTLDVGSANVTVASLNATSGSLALPTGSLNVNANNASTTSAVQITGAGTLVKSGTGLLTLNGGGPFTGTITVVAGNLRNNVVDGLPTGAALNLAGSGSAYYPNFNQSLASLAGSSNSSVNIAGATLTVGSANTDTAYLGTFVGGGTLAKLGTGTLTLGAGPADNLSPNTAAALVVNVNAGTLALNKAVNTSSIAGPVNLNGGTLLLNRSHQIADTVPLNITAGNFNVNGSTETIGNLTGAGGTITLAGGALTVTQSTPATYAGTLTGPGNFNKAGAADLTLPSTAPFTGTVTANAGRLILQGTLGATGFIANNTGTLRLNATTINLSAGNIVANAGGTIEYNDTTIANGFLRGAGTHVLLPTGTATFNGVATFNSTVISQNGPAFFNNFTNGGTLNNNAPATFNGGANAPAATLNVNSTLTTLDFTNSGIVNIANAATLANTGGNFVAGGGSRTTINPGATLSSPAGTTVELNGALLVNNGSLAAPLLNINFGSLVTGTGSFPPVVVNLGGTFQPGNTPAPLTPNVNAPIGVITSTPGAFSVAAPVTLAVDTTATFPNPADSLTFTAPMTSPVNLTKTGPGTFNLPRLEALSLTADSGRLAITPAHISAATSRLGALTLTGTGVFDLNDNDLLLDLSDPVAAQSQIRQYLLAGNLASTSAANDPQHRTALGYVPNTLLGRSTFDGQVIDASTLVIKYTYLGDANLDGTINADDFALLDKGFQQHAGTWAFGDFNYDGTVNSADYLLIDRVFIQQTGQLSPTLLATRESQFGPTYVSTLLASLPEPSLLAACGFAFPLLLPRRRRISTPK